MVRFFLFSLWQHVLYCSHGRKTDTVVQTNKQTNKQTIVQTKQETKVKLNFLLFYTVTQM